MGKLSALLVGTFLLLVLAYSELASGFTPLINWLGPILGIPLQFLLGLIFMMIGNPLAYPSVLIDWVALGVVIGLIVRRTGGGGSFGIPGLRRRLGIPGCDRWHRLLPCVS